jgi:hypothetical protein
VFSPTTPAGTGPEQTAALMQCVFDRGCSLNLQSFIHFNWRTGEDPNTDRTPVFCIVLE